jgi:hypothetical protein
VWVLSVHDHIYRRIYHWTGLLLNTQGKLIAILNHIHGKTYLRQDFLPSILGNSHLRLPADGLNSLKDREVRWMVKLKYLNYDFVSIGRAHNMLRFYL